MGEGIDLAFLTFLVRHICHFCLLKSFYWQSFYVGVRLQTDLHFKDLSADRFFHHGRV